MSKNNKKGLFVIISGPGGAGKDSIANELAKKIPNTARLVTTTSRLPRPGEKAGVDKGYVSKEEFERKIKNGDFVETNNLADNWYGSEKKRLEEALRARDTVYSTLDVHGKENFDRAGIPNLAIFIMPDETTEKSLEVLRFRMEKRGGMTEEKIKKRLNIAKAEMETADKLYPIKVINREGKLSEAVDEVEKIIKRFQSGLS